MINHPVLIIEDDANLRQAYGEILKKSDIAHICCETAEQAISTIETQALCLIVTDINLPKKSGFDVLAYCRSAKPQLPILMMTAFGSITSAVDAIRYGALDYLLKPFEPQKLIDMVHKFALQDADNWAADEPIIEDEQSKKLLDMAARVADSDATVLVMGESGTGKEVLSRFIHTHSKRNEGPFVAINCAAIPENMLEAILFGHEKGAFTGAHQAAAGKFELANGGTILLDEISEMELGLQAKLLRVIQEQEVERIGGKKTIPLDVRIIATTNRDLRNEVKENRFREDLYYRLNVFPLQWLPLRERRDDIIPIAKALLEKQIKKSGRPVVTFSPAALNRLAAYSWPGNIRELDNVIQRALILQNGDEIGVEELMFIDMEATDAIVEEQDRKVLGNDLKKRESEIILDTLKGLNGSRRKTADKLGISERTLRYKLAKMRDDGVNLEEAIS